MTEPVPAADYERPKQAPKRPVKDPLVRWSEVAHGMRMMAIELEKSAVALERTARDLRNRARIARDAAARYDGSLRHD